MRPFNLSYGATWQAALALAILAAMAAISIGPALARDDEGGYYRGHGGRHYHRYWAQYYPYGYYYAPYSPPIVVYPAPPPPVAYVPPPQPVYVAPPPVYFPLSVGLFFHFH